jgi:molecular chaperone GrpE (heat shock protein)
MTKLTDQLLERIRKDPMTDDDDLRSSLRGFGWLPDLPAIKDEHGRILVGNRRMRIAEELGIRPMIRTVTFGAGTEADAGRIALAVASNLGNRPMDGRDRKRIALYLHSERRWEPERIATALKVNMRKIRSDLGLTAPAKGERPQREDKPSPQYDRAREVVRPFVERSESISRDELAAQHGLSPNTLQRAELAERAAKEARDNPVVDPQALPKTAQEKLAAAERQMRKRLEREFDERVSKGVQSMLEQVLPRLKARETAANRTMKAYKGVMQRTDLMLVLSCLHPDSRVNATDEKLTRAFQLVKKLEPTLLSGADLANEPIVPESWADLRRKNGASVKP